MLRGRSTRDLVGEVERQLVAAEVRAAVGVVALQLRRVALSAARRRRPPTRSLAPVRGQNCKPRETTSDHARTTQTRAKLTSVFSITSQTPSLATTSATSFGWRRRHVSRTMSTTNNDLTVRFCTTTSGVAGTMSLRGRRADGRRRQTCVSDDTRRRGRRARATSPGRLGRCCDAAVGRRRDTRRRAHARAVDAPRAALAALLDRTAAGARQQQQGERRRRQPTRARECACALRSDAVSRRPSTTVGGAPSARFGLWSTDSDLSSNGELA